MCFCKQAQYQVTQLSSLEPKHLNMWPLLGPFLPLTPQVPNKQSVNLPLHKRSIKSPLKPSYADAQLL